MEVAEGTEAKRRFKVGHYVEGHGSEFQKKKFNETQVRKSQKPILKSEYKARILC